MKHVLKGFTLIEIMIVVAIIAILAAVAIPNFVKYRNESQRSSCISNMKQLQTAGEQFMMVNGVDATPGLSDLCGATLYLKKTPKCPYSASGDYTLGVDSTSKSVTVTCPNVGDSNCAGHTLPDTAAAASS